MRNIKQHACGERHSSETGKSQQAHVKEHYVSKARTSFLVLLVWIYDLHLAWNDSAF